MRMFSSFLVKVRLNQTKCIHPMEKPGELDKAKFNEPINLRVPRKDNYDSKVKEH